MEKLETGVKKKQLIITTLIGILAMTFGLLVLFYAESSVIQDMAGENYSNIVVPRIRNYFYFWAIGSVSILMGTINNNKNLQIRAESDTIKHQNMKLKEAQEIQKRFTLTTAHDLRTPITSVKGYLDLIKSGYVEFESDQYWSFVNTIEKCVIRVETLTDNLLESQKLDSGAVKLDLGKVPVDSFVEEVIAEIKPIYSERNQSLVCDLSYKTQDMTVDKMKLIQVVINLLTNASKFSSEDSEILFEVNEDSDYIVFKVKDQGIGLKEEDFSQLFTPFPDITVEGNYNRTGLGLSIAKGIVELHKGEIFAESKGVGKGSTFGFKIPKN